MSEKDMAQEIFSYLIIDDNNDIVDVEAWYLNMFYFTNNKKLIYHWEFSHALEYLSSLPLN